MKNFYHKKIGIWGFGIVGKSALHYFDRQGCSSIQILNSKEFPAPTTQTPTACIVQTPQSVQNFLHNNDVILASPGIALHAYQQFAHKFISELDLIAQQFNGTTVAITGTIGKTSITHILTQIFKTTHPDTIAAGNIGTAMLSLLDNQPTHAILELSSFQLQQTDLFAPDLAIITNFYPNHLDHHQSLEEYLLAKCNIFKHQRPDQTTLLPLDLVEQINEYLPMQRHWAFFTEKLTDGQLKKYTDHTIYYLDNKVIYKTLQGDTKKIYDLTHLPALTFDTNWLIIVAACDLANINLATLAPAVHEIELPDHRLQKVGSKNGSDFYNDSKSTVWQATLQAVNAMDASKPTALFLGGLSKGADRTPLLQALAGKNIMIYAFGKEAEQIAQLCKQFNIAHQRFSDLDTAWQACKENLTTPTNVLFSPGGSSYDLFIDYQDRGRYFTKLVQDHHKE